MSSSSYATAGTSKISPCTRVTAPIMSSASMPMPSPIHRRENRVIIRAPTFSICAAFAMFALRRS
jgi:hypothetical protein